MTAISCVALAVAFLVAVVLLVFAGILIGWVIPALLERAREARDGSPPNRD